MSAERVFLVTGATGVVGSAIVPLLLAEPRARVHMLIRAASADDLAARVDGLMDFWQERVDRQLLGRRLFAVAGDVRMPLLGMSDAVHESLTAEVTNIVHSAGEVKLNQSITEARASALLPAQRMIEFARTCGKSRATPKIEHLSTVGVAGRRAGLVPETPLDWSLGYHNTYERAKAETEALLLGEIDSGLPVTIHRPSMVVGDSRDGRIIRFQVFYHLIRFIAGSRTGGWLPRFEDVRLDLVPADFVARAIIVSSRNDDCPCRVFHLCSGPLGAVPLVELGDVLRRFLDERGETVWRPRYISPPAMRLIVRCASVVARPQTRNAVRALPYFLDYLKEDQLFANSVTAEYLCNHGVSLPASDQFLPKILDYWYTRTASAVKRPAERGIGTDVSRSSG